MIITDPKLLLGQALKILSLRPRSKKEIEVFLKKKTSDTNLINQTITKLEESKLIDDSEFAKWYVESRSRSRPRGSRLLKQELKSKGITGVVQVDEVALAESALLKKKNIKSKEQIIHFLQYRGFSWGVIEKVLKTGYNREDVNDTF